MRRAVLMPHPESVPGFSIVVLATLCLRLPGESATETKTLASNSRALLLCVVFTDLLGIFLTLWFNQNYMKQFVQRKIIGVGRW